MQSEILPSKVNALKAVLDQYLRSNNVYSQIREILSKNIQEHKSDVDSQDLIMSALQEKGVIGDILKSLGQPQSASYPIPASSSSAASVPSSSAAPIAPAHTSSSASSASPPSSSSQSVKITPGRRYLHVQLHGGRAFVESLIDDALSLRGQKGGASASLQLCVQYRGQRFKSHHVPYTVEPRFDDSFLIDLQPPGMDVVPFESLLESSDQLHLLVLRHDYHASSSSSAAIASTSVADVSSSEVSVVASRFVEWRKALVHGKLALSVEMIGGTADLKTPVGLIDFDLEVLPTPPPSSYLRVAPPSASSSSAAAAPTESDLADTKRTMPVFIPQSVVVKQINRERVVATETEQRFRAYTKSWWRDYQQIRPQHQNRAISMFAMCEDGSRKFVSCFVTPINAGRFIESSLHAARFVRLIPFERELKIGGERSGMWNTTHTFLSLGKGDLENHVLLLCSLLLGFGLDAYVCVGANARGPHMWVVTRSSDSGQVVFWESLTGRRLQVQPPRVGDAEFVAANYLTVGSVFNHRSFYANAQADDSVLACEWQLENDQLWKSLSPEAISMLTPLPSVCLSGPTLNVAEEEERLEFELRALLSAERKHAHQMEMIFDSEFSYLLSPSLSAYEWERITGFAYGNDEFQQAVKQHIPISYVFKGSPIQFNTRNARKVVASLLKNDSCADILGARGDSLRFGLRVKVFAYAENVCAVWVMLAVKYKPVE